MSKERRKFAKTLYFSQEVDVEVDMDEIDTDDLIEELQRRGVEEGEASTMFDTPVKVKNHLISLFGLRDWATKKDIINEIEELYNRI